MQNLRLTDQADLGFIFETVQRRISEDEWKKTTAEGAVTKDVFIAYCISQKYPSIGFEYDGKPIGGMLFDGSAVHIEVLPEYHGRWGLLWRSAMKWFFALKDPIFVAVDRDNEKCHQFMARNNWPCVKEDEKTMTYEMSSRASPIYQRIIASQKKRGLCEA